MAVIRVLDPETINQIAAGEVVERPASVVKELVENSIDAKSTAVTVEIKNGGIDFIRITDNGQGIEKDQIKTAFLRHATSKIRNADDLIGVSSLGFRGEALSSVAAVSKVELITKTESTISGVRYVIEGGEEQTFEEIGCPEGTTFIIRNLFYNTPARRKFLKSSMTEAGYVESFMQRLALSHPDISFKFIIDGRNKMVTAGNGSLKDVIYQIFGRETAANLLPVAMETNEISMEGFIGKPVLSRGNRNYEYYFVNGRYLKNPIISKAIEDGYKGHAMVHKFPFTALMITMDGHLFDANVHPSKMEMRFHKGEELYQLITDAVRAAFHKRDLIPKEAFGKNEQEQMMIPKKIPEPFEKRRREIEEHFAQITPEKIQKLEAVRKKETLQDKIDKLRKQKETTQTITVEEAIPLKPHLTDHSGRKDEKVREASSYGRQLSFQDDPVLKMQSGPDRRIIGQIFNTYWLMEYDEKLYIIDQHAAHEKVLYEKFKKQFSERKAESQMVAPPIVLSFSIHEKGKFLKAREGFEQLGYQIEEFGGNEFCIRAVPSNLTNVNQQELFVEILDQMDEQIGNVDLSIITDRLATMACKAAVKGNSSMTKPEMEALIKQLLTLENPYQCPHGRPTIISMSRYEIEKKFKRV